MKHKWIKWVVLVTLVAVLVAATQVWAKSPSRQQGTQTNEPFDEPDLPDTETFTSLEYGYSFEYPGEGWALVEESAFDEVLSYVSLVTSDSDELITVAVLPNPERKSAAEWIQDTASAYNQELIQIQDDLEVKFANHDAILLTQPQSCETVAMLVIVFTTDDLSFTISYFAPGDSSGLPAYQELLESFRIAQTPKVSNVLPHLSLPTAIQEPCPEPLAPLSQPIKCSGAPFFIPAEGYVMSAYGCWGGTWCSVYGQSDPHKGIDIGPVNSGTLWGNGTPGVIDVYAPVEGTVIYISPNTRQGLKLRHNAHNVDTYFAHMANNSTNESYINVSYGQTVSAGQPLGKMGNYGCYETHLHFNIMVVGGSDLNWSHSKDPTPYLNARDLVFYSGWQRHPMSCLSSADTTPPTISFSVSNPAEDHWYNSNRTLSWSVSDSESGVDYFKWEWDDSTPDNRVDSDHGSSTLSAAGQGKHTLYVKAWNGVGLSTQKSASWFGYDTTKPNISINPGCNALNNQWQNTCRDPNFTWNGTDPNGIAGSGIADYAYMWGTDSSADPSNWSSTTSYDPGPIADPDGWNRYYLHVKARDIAGNLSSLGTFGLWYDGTVPIVTLQINNGADTTNQTSVLLNLSVSDTGSGVAEVCVSNSVSSCTNWQPYSDSIAWTLPALDRRTHTIYVHVRDRAGNETSASDDIYLDLYPPMPHSDNYRICADVINVGGSVGITSTGYSLVSAIGQPWATGANANVSGGFSERSGFLADINGCLPITHTSTNAYTVTNWVIASGGNLRGSASYRLGDTTGQLAASGATGFTSANYQLSSGFWSQITGTVPPTSTIPTPAPSPTPTPKPGGFGVSINDGSLYTNDPVVMVRTWAPNVTHMRLSNDGGYSDEGWRTYQVTMTWTLSTYGDYVMPRYVYAWFRDAGSSVYGTYFDDIVYDPVAPEGQVGIVGTEIPTATLLLEAYDDNSGVSEMRIASSLDEIGDASWQPYTDTLTWEMEGSVVYA